MKYICSVCGYVYDEEKEGKKFAELPDTWACPRCGAPKSSFKPVVQPEAFFKISYGLYLLSTKLGEKDNACIINTLTQVTVTPTQVQVTVNKSDYTCELIQKSKIFAVSMLDESTPFDLFKRFGFQSGRTVDKFAGFDWEDRTDNHSYFLTKYANSFVSAKVVSEIDLGTHIMFIGEVTQAKVLNANPSLTYNYYQANIKPKPQQAKPAASAKWVCRICGYVYDDAKEKIPFEKLPDTWTCPLCHHPKSDFDKVA
jgi:flavin reductase (DIM6/NTAB) family NADH-FMN oxidoreductase RutF